MLKRYIATVRLEVDAESIEARDFLVETMVMGINKRRAGVLFPDVGSAQVRKAAVGRMRPAPEKKRK